MIKKQNMEFIVLSYSPSAVRAEQIHIGVVLFERVGDRIASARARFTQDWDGVLKFDPNADTNLLRCLFRDIEQRLESPEDREAFLQTMQDTFSNVIQVSDSRTITSSGDPANEIARLESQYLCSS